MHPEIRNSSKDLYEIDRKSYEPAYLQLARILRRQIVDGVFRSGDQIPSEAQLTQRYGISPMTVRRCINILAEQGVVNTSQGRGTFVKELELSTAIFDLQDLHDLFKQGAENIVKLLEVHIVAADERIARKLDLPIGTPTIYICRLFTRDGQPIFFHRAYLIYDPARPILESEMDVTSLQGLFTSGEDTLVKCGQLKIDVTLMNQEEAEYLQQPMPSAAFHLEHLFSDFNNRPISWGWFIIPGDRLHLTTSVGIQD